MSHHLTLSPNPFVAQRLREARLANRLTLQDLADGLGVSKQVISQYELGLTVPSDDSLGRLSRLLNRPLAFFFWQVHGQTDGVSAVFFRKGSSASVKEVGPVRSYLSWLSGLVFTLERWISLPPVSIRPITQADYPYSPEDLEAAAQTTRRAMKLGNGPIANVSRLLEHHGAVVAHWPFTDAPIDAGSQWINRRPLIITGRIGVSMVRQRLSEAHELGHMVLHATLDEQTVKKDHKIIEHEADYFAGAFLLPAETFGQECLFPSLSFLQGLKPRWKVSIAAMIKRAEQLGIFTKDDSGKLFKQLNARRWRQIEPFDRDWDVEEPVLFHQALEILHRDDVDVYTEFRNDLPLPLDEIVALTHVESARFDTNWLRLKRPGSPGNPITSTGKS